MHPSMYTREKDGKTLEYIRIPVVKSGSTAKDQEYVEVCLQEIVDETTYAQILFDGLKKHINAGNTKVIKGDKADAVAKAEAQREKIYEGKVKVTGGRAKSGESNDVIVLARSDVKKKLKAQAKRANKVKVSLIKDSTWTKLANEYLESEFGAKAIAEAKAKLERMEAEPLEGIDLSQLKEDDELKEKAAAKKAEKKTAEEELRNSLPGVKASRKGEQHQARN
jgi:hypothetical protein